MDQAENPLEFYLRQLARGDEQYLSATLELLANQILYTPVSIGGSSGNGDVQKFKVVTLISGGKKIVPTFTSEEYFGEWADEHYQCLPVSGADLAVTLPGDSWLSVNPGFLGALELSPENLQDLIESDLQREDSIELEPEEDSLSRVDYTSALEQVEQTLQILLNNYSEVKEAYYFEQAGVVPEGALGLLTNDLSAERRFELIAEIGEVARLNYGFAGAIETYDDLHLQNSSSWSLFSTLTPFYVYDENSPADYDYALSNAAAEEIQTGNSEHASEETPPDNAATSAMDTAWDKLRTKGPELLRVLGFVKD